MFLWLFLEIQNVGMEIRGILFNKIFEKEFIFNRAVGVNSFTEAKLFHRVFAEHLCQCQRLSIS